MIARYKHDLTKIQFLGPQTHELIPSHIDSLYFNDVISVPCGHCELCLIERRYSNALRIMLESKCHSEKTYFITLTYDNDHIEDNELNHNHWSQFMKDFRKEFCEAKYCKIKDRGSKKHGKTYSKTFKKIKQVMSGEYGDSFGRRHFHGIIFNHSFSDVYDTGFFSKKGNRILSSKTLQKVWGRGNVQLEEVNMDLALYVGSYLTDRSYDKTASAGKEKKQYGRLGKGIGLEWIKRYWKSVLIADKVMMLDRDYPIPRYFHKKIQELHPLAYAEYKQKKLLQVKEKSERIIKKGEGPLLRSQKKGEIRKLINEKRKINYGINQ